jgi:hypothetical protein
MPDPFDSFQLPSELRELLPEAEQQTLRDEILDIHVRLLKRDPELEDNRSRGLHLRLLFDAVAKRLQSQPDFREHVVPAVIPTFIEQIKSDLSWYPNSDENLGYFLKPVIVQWQNFNSKKVEAPPFNNAPEGEHAGESFRPRAPAFRYEYPPELPDTEQLAIENARLEANRCLENREVRSFDDYTSAYVAWFWHLVFAAANAIGRAGECLHWGANRRRELLKAYSLKAAKAADIAGKFDYRFKDLCDSREWRAADDCLLRPTDYENRKDWAHPEVEMPNNPESVQAVGEPPGQEVDSATIAQQTRALTVARLIRELDALKPQMFEDKAEYEKLRAQHPKFIAFEIAEARPDLKLKILGIRGSIRHIRLAQELAAAHHGRELSTIQEDWKNHKPQEFRRAK